MASKEELMDVDEQVDDDVEVEHQGSKKKKKQRSKKRQISNTFHYTGTIFDGTDGKIQKFLNWINGYLEKPIESWQDVTGDVGEFKGDAPMDKFIGQVEDTKDGKLHLQFAWRWRSRHALNLDSNDAQGRWGVKDTKQFMEAAGCGAFHFEKTAGSDYDNKMYCTKPNELHPVEHCLNVGCIEKGDTDHRDRKAGPWSVGDWSNKMAHGGAGQRRDLSEIHKDARDLKVPIEDMDEKYVEMLRMDAAVIRMRGRRIKQMVKERHAPEVIVIYGETGTRT
jgi:hypothetical protein